MPLHPSRCEGRAIDADPLAAMAPTRVAALAALMLVALVVLGRYFPWDLSASGEIVGEVVLEGLPDVHSESNFSVGTSWKTASPLVRSTHSPTQLSTLWPRAFTRQRQRRQVVYIYDWWNHCKSIGLCAEATPKASRAAACMNTTKHQFQCQEDPYGADASKNLSSWFAQSKGVVIRHTHQFSASSLYDARLIASEWRTFDPDEAELFYIPFDPEIDYLQFDSKFGRLKYEWLMKHVANSKHFKRFQGRDHFMAISK